MTSWFCAPRARSAALAATLSLLVGGTVATTAAAPAQASTTVTGSVTAVLDGDTIDVDVKGDGTSTPRRVRVAGIQAMELHHYSSDLSQLQGECWGPEATRRMSALVLHRTVRLSALHASSESRGRWLRHLDVWNGSSWSDVGRRMLGEGLAIPDVNKVEYTRNRAYMGVAMWAAAHHRGLYGDPDHCGSGPSQANPIVVTVHWKGGGSVNGEFIHVQNRGRTTISLAGWWVRDNALRRYTFPSTARIRPGGSVYVHPGKGSRTATQFFWGLSAAIFEDASRAPLWLGDGGYLFDPQGDLRAWQQYRLT